MPATLEKIASEALQLSPELRAELADILLGSLETPPNDDIQEAWTREAIRRRGEVQSGKSKYFPARKSSLKPGSWPAGNAV